MPGIYVLLSDANGVLKPTAGNTPHITLAYYGGPALVNDVCQEVIREFEDLWSQETVVLTDVHMSTYEKKGVTQYDVLANLSMKDQHMVNLSRKVITHSKLGQHGKLIMRDPHVSIHRGQNKEEAEKVMESYRSLTTQVTGISSRLQ